MKHQLCRNCGHRHLLGAPCIFDDEPEVGESEVQKSVTVLPVAPTLTDAPSSSGRIAGLGPADVGSNPAGATKSLTPAEKQKRWRTSGDVEGKKQRNTERMASKRGEDG